MIYGPPAGGCSSGLGLSSRCEPTYVSVRRDNLICQHLTCVLLRVGGAHAAKASDSWLDILTKIAQRHTEVLLGSAHALQLRVLHEIRIESELIDETRLNDETRATSAISNGHQQPHPKGRPQVTEGK